ncbi:SPOR domain-containing protein [Vibrio marisflavi]|uniref:Cell division protein FtsN n=1 Tax=Vibrio marisflavi CECT 7928 TaxID=634439 RepID=A0ABN8E7W3_9VIBR|nr:SPOR domain-containing protein [Vibrio marisflavi]CAH0541706.1 Cell division protein FtsN [Vibrio marisflavi CECT 7928]
MASKDYVRRGSGQNKKRGSKKKASPSRKPWRSGIIAVILVSAFGYGLYTLSKDPEPPKAVIQPSKSISSKPAAKLPPPPEEKWDYVDTLPNREIEVKAKPLVESKIPYVMQCGAYKTKHQAETRKVDIAFQGLTSNIVKKEGSSWYRVVLGPYKTKRDAEKDKHKLQRVKIQPCAIWKQNQ